MVLSVVDLVCSLLAASSIIGLTKRRGVLGRLVGWLRGITAAVVNETVAD